MTMVTAILQLINAICFCVLMFLDGKWFGQIDRRIELLLKTHRNLLEAMLKASEKDKEEHDEAKKPKSPYDNQQIKL